MTVPRQCEKRSAALLIFACLLACGCDRGGRDAGAESSKAATGAGPSAVGETERRTNGQAEGAVFADTPADLPDMQRRNYHNNCLTAGCHAQVAQKRWLHSPVSVGACEHCHEPQGEPQEHQFVVGKSCSDCHRWDASSIQHEPFEKGRCMDCHDPHGGDTKGFIAAETLKELCVGCHDLQTGAQPHAPIESGDCTSCHAGHQSEHPGLLKRVGLELCLGCHKSIRQDLDVKDFHHGAIQEGTCVACHQPHWSPHRKLLLGDYPNDYYVPYSADSYPLCFGCHDRRLVTEEQTTLTNFRDGSRNLHHVHVNREKGRSCVICHEPHASVPGRQMRLSAPFGPGEWELPIRFVYTPTGGSCTSGCHQELHYDNSNPPGVPLKASLPVPESKGR